MRMRRARVYSVSLYPRPNRHAWPAWRQRFLEEAGWFIFVALMLVNAILWMAL